MTSLLLAAGVAAIQAVPAWPANDVPTGSVSGLPIPRFVSLKSDRVNARSGPNKDQEVRWVYTHAGMPVEVTAEFENWRRIRDWEGAEGWVYHSLLSGKRMATVVPKTERGTGAALRKGGCRVPDIGALAARRARRAEVLQWQLVPIQRQGLRWLCPAGATLGRLSEREGGLGASTYDFQKHDARYRPGMFNWQSCRFVRSGLAPQAYDHVNARDFKAFRRCRGLADDDVCVRDIEHLVLAFNEEVMMRRHVGVEIGL